MARLNELRGILTAYDHLEIGPMDRADLIAAITELMDERAAVAKRKAA